MCYILHEWTFSFHFKICQMDTQQIIVTLFWTKNILVIKILILFLLRMRDFFEMRFVIFHILLLPPFLLLIFSFNITNNTILPTLKYQMWCTMAKATKQCKWTHKNWQKRISKPRNTKPSQIGQRSRYSDCVLLILFLYEYFYIKSSKNLVSYFNVKIKNNLLYNLIHKNDDKSVVNAKDNTFLTPV